MTGAQSEVAENARAVDAPAQDQNIERRILKMFNLLAAVAGHSLDSLAKMEIRVF